MVHPEGGISVEAVGGLRDVKRDKTGFTIEYYWLINDPLQPGYRRIGPISKHPATLENLPGMFNAPEIIR